MDGRSDDGGGEPGLGCGPGLMDLIDGTLLWSSTQAISVAPVVITQPGGLILVGGGGRFRARRRWPWEIEQPEPIPDVVDVDRILAEVGRREQLRVEDELLLVLEG